MNKDEQFVLVEKPWESFTEEEYVYFCGFVDHEILDQIEKVLKEKNVVR